MRPDVLDIDECKYDGEERWSYPCGLRVPIDIEYAPQMVVAAKFQHLKHHQDLHTKSFDSYSIKIDVATGKASCTEFCEGNTIQFGTYELLYNNLHIWGKQEGIECEPVENTAYRMMACGLLLTDNNLESNWARAHDGHTKHHKENHKLIVTDPLTITTYSVTADGKCHCTIASEIYIDEYRLAGWPKYQCKEINRNSKIVQFICGMVMPTSASPMMYSKLAKVHEHHHVNKHPRQPIIIPVDDFEICVCNQTNEDKEPERMLMI